METEGWSMLKPNEKQLNEQRNKYVDQAIQKIIPELNLPEDKIKFCLTGDIDMNPVMDLICSDVLRELKEKQGISEDTVGETLEGFNQEYNKMAIKRRIKFHFTGIGK